MCDLKTGLTASSYAGSCALYFRLDGERCVNPSLTPSWWWPIDFLQLGVVGGFGGDNLSSTSVL